ncbi:MAG: hypothetical protein PQJ58_17585, partial [Spirochaetales bacterium]|nr:hypothetical protein [Spirochaetales bacterium]
NSEKNQRLNLLLERKIKKISDMKHRIHEQKIAMTEYKKSINSLKRECSELSNQSRALIALFKRRKLYNPYVNLLFYLKYSIKGNPYFNIDYYKKKYCKSGIKQFFPFLHFVFRGVYMGYSPSEEISVFAYIKKHPEFLLQNEFFLSYYNTHH